ncbi:alpha/beta-hydrolase [Dichomitus squalens]|uniref:Carboxylic ester hydrolase n=1 Tax=Dichomitus squalens TaxID=114155 RepID=A0A4Q9NX68_9APHY|nr:alpha/beta-hydrolase [Dichomitus squalens]TBU61505.1 alpha/beta-hydrolase [Dichomitus squalens]
MFSRLASLLQLVVLLGTATASPTHDTPAVVRPITVSISTSSDLSSSPSSLSAASLSSTPASTSSPSTPLATAALDKAQVIGIVNGSVNTFNGIPFAEPPVGDLRLRFPVPIHGYNGTIDATQPATQCIQLEPQIRVDMPPQMLQDVVAYSASVLPTSSAPQSEDCLNINVQIPTGTKPGEKLPVVAYIFGGGFVVGSNAQISGDALVARSVEMGQPVIFAAMNYRLHAFGFLGGKEVKDAGVGNLGLHDQREALRWIQKNIAAFGGDPEKVTLWGPSAGAISSALQMVTNGGNTEGLFRGSVMSAGSTIPTGYIEELQPIYDRVVDAAGCNVADDTLECLRQLPTANLTAAAGTIPSLFGYPGLATPWLPQADGKFLTAPPEHLVLANQVADIPFISGDALDEGTIFASGSYNVTTEQQFRDYVHHFFFPHVPSAALLEPLFDLYPNDPAAGSPFLTGDANQLAPMYKRMAAFQGDMIFQAPRRFILDQRSSKQPTWSYISKRGAVPGLGAAHGTDFSSAISGQELTDYIIQFTATQDPNGKNGTASERTIYWPKYDTAKRQVLSVLNDSLAIGNDTLRLEPIASLTALSIAFPL